jgi:GPN-loop GTPase
MSSGQIELYTHHPLLPSLVTHLSRIGFRTCAVYMLESQFMEDRYKFFRSVYSLYALGALFQRFMKWSLVRHVRHGQLRDPVDQCSFKNGSCHCC